MPVIVHLIRYFKHILHSSRDIRVIAGQRPLERAAREGDSANTLFVRTIIGDK